MRTLRIAHLGLVAVLMVSIPFCVSAETGDGNLQNPTITGPGDGSVQTCAFTPGDLDAAMMDLQVGQPLLKPVLYYKPLSALKVIERTPEAMIKAGEPPELAAVGSTYVEYNKKYGFATASLVNRCNVLTVYHAVFAEGQAPSTKVNVLFMYGHGSFDSYKEAILAHPIAWDYSLDHDRKHLRPTCGQDWVLLRLDHCVDQSTPYLSLASFDDNQLAGDFKEAGMLNFEDHLNGVYVDPLCEGLGLRRDEHDNIVPGDMAHHCASQEHASGSPIMALGSLNKPSIVALACAGHGENSPSGFEDPSDRSKLNVASPLSAFWTGLEKALKTQEPYIFQQTGKHWKFGDSWHYKGKVKK